jgi:hypothetical protein
MRTFHEREGYVEQATHTGDKGDKRRRWYQLTEKDVELRNERQRGAGARTAQEVGAMPTSAANILEGALRPEFLGRELPATDPAPYSVPAPSQSSVIFGNPLLAPSLPGQQATWAG